MAFVGAGNDGERLSACGARVIERADDCGQIVSVNHFRGPALRLEFALINFHIVLVHGVLALSERVDIGEGDQIIEAVIRREGCRFPDISFGQFAVARQDVNARGRFSDASADSEARTHGEPLA